MSASITVSLKSKELHDSWLARRQQLEGKHRVKVREVFTPAYLQSKAQILSVRELATKAGIDQDKQDLRYLTSDDWKLLNDYIARHTSFPNWQHFLADAGAQWVKRQLLDEGSSPSSSPPSTELDPGTIFAPTSDPLESIERDTTLDSIEDRASRPPKRDGLPNADATRPPQGGPNGPDLSRLPSRVVDELAGRGLAWKFDRPGMLYGIFGTVQAAVIRVVASDGQVRNFVMVGFRSPKGNPFGAWGDFYRVVAQPIGENQDPANLAETFIFIEEEIGRLEMVAWWLDLSIELVPLGTLAKHVATGEGDILETLITTMGDVAALGTALRVAGKVAGVVTGLEIAEGVLQATAASFQAARSVQLYFADDLSQAKAEALEATLRLMGITALTKKRLKQRRGKEAESDAKRTLPFRGDSQSEGTPPSGVQDTPKTGVQANKFAGDAARDKIAEREAPALIEQIFHTVGGIRRVDVVKLEEELTAIESKVGRTRLGSRGSSVRRELARDWWLKRQGQVSEVIWEFSRSDITGLVGPADALLEKLEKLGFQVRINP